MFNFLQNTVVDTDDEGLRRLTHERLKVFAQFTTDNCETCRLLGPGFAKFADDEEYLGILFVRLDSDENPVSKHLMNVRAAPFFVSYCQGRILECDTRETDDSVQAQLARLRSYLPKSA